jgi:hypothetical protein
MNMAVFVTVILAPAIADPMGSSTVPTIRPVAYYPKAESAKINANTVTEIRTILINSSR